MICRFGDVVVVPFPFVEQPVAKRRPALVLSKEDFNSNSGQSILAMITSAAGSSWPSDVTIEDGQSAGLVKRSVLRWKLFTMPNNLIIRKLGKLSTSDEARVVDGSMRILPQPA